MAPAKTQANSEERQAAPTVVVQGAGSPDANGIYVWTELKVRGSAVFQKPGTRLSVLKRGEDSTWALVDLGGKPAGGNETKEYEPAKTSVSVMHSGLGSSLLRFRPQAIVLYQVGPLLNCHKCPLPPEVGWLAVEGDFPAPVISLSEKHANLRELLRDVMPGKLVAKVAEASPSSSKIASNIYKPQRSFSETSLPRVATGGSFGSLQSGKVPTSRVRARLPGVPGNGALQRQFTDVAGELVMVYFSVLLTRPSFHCTWGIVFDNSELACSGRRVICDVERNSPLDRWNTWQAVRGRPDMCVRPGDQLLKLRGHWAFAELPLESAEGFEHLPRATEGSCERPAGKGDTQLYLEFGRLVKRPPPPSPPRLEAWEVGHGLRIEFDVSHAGVFAPDVLAWSLILKEDIPEGTIGAGPSGRPSTSWHVYDAEAGKVIPVVRGKEVASIPADRDGGITEMLVSTGVKHGRSYTACLAVLTNAGWSAFSEPSRSIQLRQRPGPPDGVLSMVLPAEGSWTATSPSQQRSNLGQGCQSFVCYALPVDLKPCFTSPIVTQSSIGNTMSLLSKKRLLMLQLVLPHGRPKGLSVTVSEGGSCLVVEEGGYTPPGDIEEKTEIRLSGMTVQWKILPGDFIVRINGITNGMEMIQELQRNPPTLAVEVLRAAGGRKSEASHYFPLVMALDEDYNKAVEEMRTHGLVNIYDAEVMMVLAGRRDDFLGFALRKAQKQRYDDYRAARQLPPDYRLTQLDLKEMPPNLLLEEAERRLLVLRRTADPEHFHEDSAPTSAASRQMILTEACRHLELAMADASMDHEAMSRSVTKFKKLGGNLISGSTVASKLLKRAVFQAHLWFWRKTLRSAQEELKEACEHMLRLEQDERAYLAEFPGSILPRDKLAVLIDGRNDLREKVMFARTFKEELTYDLIEAEAVFERSMTQRKQPDALGAGIDEGGFTPAKSLKLGQSMGWW